MDNLSAKASSLSIGQKDDDSKDQEMECPICQKKSTMTCSACKSVAYCCVDHQKLDWKNHKKVCQPFIIKETEDMGLGWFATRDLKAGVVLIEELPVIQAPGWTDQRTDVGTKICLTCTAKMQSMRACSTCSWPVCSEQCEKDPIHKDNECKELVLRKLKYPPPASLPAGMLVMYMRAKALKIRDPQKFKQLMALQDFLPIPSSNQELQKRDLPVGMFEVLSGPDSLDREELRKLMRIFSVNGGDFRNTSAESHVQEARSLDLNFHVYLKTSRINHSCSPNCMVSIGPAPAKKTRILTTVPITKGEQLTLDWLEGLGLDFGLVTTGHRQTTFNQGGFICKCKRCLDPTELGTFPKGIKCFKCSSKLKIGSDDENTIGYFLPTDPYDDYSSADSVFECHRCHVQYPIWRVMNSLPDALRNLFVNIHKLTEAETIDHKALDALLTKYEEDSTINGYFHKNYFAVQNAIRELIKVQMKNLDTMTEEELDRLVRRLEFRLSIADKLYPGSGFKQKCEGLSLLYNAVQFFMTKYSSGMSNEKFLKLELIAFKTMKGELEFMKLNKIDSAEEQVKINDKLKEIKEAEIRAKRDFA